VAEGIRHRVGSVTDFEPGRFHVVEVAGRQVGVVHTSAGFFAVRNSCPHAQAPICSGKVGGTWLPSDPDEREYGLDGRVVKCPWHGWEFDLTDGRALFGTSSKRLVTYAIDVDEGEVTVVLPARA
jgi:nitrite reductase (NADH) small subunit